MILFLVLTNISGAMQILAQTDEEIKFTTDVYKELLKTNSGTFLVCPLSVRIILALVQVGAGGRTLKQLSNGLRLPEHPQKVQNFIAQLLPHLETNKEYELTQANKIYIQDSFAITPAFAKTALDTFKTEFDYINFKNSGDASKKINGWVESRTGKKIKNVVTKDLINVNTCLLLINAMYFRGKWVTLFDKNSTKRRKFFSDPTRPVYVNAMETTSLYKFYRSTKLSAKFLEMPYKGDNISMTFVLPDDFDGLSKLEQHIGEIFAAPQYRQRKVYVVIPKFKTETTIGFVPVLKALGITEAFSPRANFSGISLKNKLNIDQVIQKTFIEMDEEGTTAAVSTAASMRFRTRRLERIESFVADRPFVFYIKSKAGIMFVGRYAGKG